jgi:hypothetical protein
MASHWSPHDDHQLLQITNLCEAKSKTLKPTNILYQQRNVSFAWLVWLEVNSSKGETKMGFQFNLT